MSTRHVPEAGPAGVASAALVTVRLLALPVGLFAAAQQHSDELMREFTLVAERLDDVAAGDGSPGRRPVPARLVEIVTALRGSYAGFTGEQEARLAAAVKAGEPVIDELVYRIPASVGAAAAHLEALLDEADDFCRGGQHLLTLATPPELVRFRRWYLGEFQTQAEGGPATPWPEFVDRRG